jgi:transglutaminase-like putative cysteine protease
LAAGKISIHVRRLTSVSVKLRVLSSLLVLFFPACQLAAQATSNAQKFNPPTRTFRFTYNFPVKDIPSGAKRVRIWIPVPQTDQHQTVRVLAVKAPVKTRMTQEGSQSGAVAKAKAAYDYLFTNMRYDKTGSGWGRGDAVWACDAKRGNCTDFHSPFIGMLRVDGIPARFDIGFPLPENKDKGDIAGYHCWAEFYARKTGWIPVDISEAWKAKQKEDYFFGSVDANRVQLSTGRDIALSPKQDGPALNYFVYPYVEVDGKPYDKLDKQFSFEEVKSSE